MCLCFLFGWMIYCAENNNSNSVELKLLNKPLILSIVILSKMGAHKYFVQLSKWKSCKKSHKIFWDCCLKSPKKQTNCTFTYTIMLPAESLNQRKYCSADSSQRGRRWGEVEGWSEAFFFFSRALKVSIHLHSGALTHGLFHFAKKNNLQNEPGTYRSALTDCGPVISKGREFKLPPIECKQRQSEIKS